jgi:uncharacterized protein (TIGR02145 family)
MAKKKFAISGFEVKRRFMYRAKINSKQAMLVALSVFSACSRDDVSNGYSSSEVLDLSCDSGREIEYDFFEYEDQVYKAVTIGTQTWMAENLNYNVAGSVCYGDYQCLPPEVCPACYVKGSKCYGYNGSYYTMITNQANCDKYGRLYNWVAAMALDTNCYSNSCTDKISTKHKGICPSGWHIPTQAEWNTLSSYVESDRGCSSCDAKHLKAVCWSGGSSLDTYGFAALPAGGGTYGRTGGSVGDYGYWWSATEYDDSSAYLRFMFYGSEAVHWDYYYRTYKFSVRCVKD